MKADLDLIRDAARQAGETALRLKADGALQVEFKANGTPVSNADLALDRLLHETLMAARPDYGWLSEERADDGSRLERRRSFVIDPIDGTRTFVKDRPWWAVSIAVVEDGQPVAGVVHAPELDELYEASAGGGAWLNGAPIATSARAALKDCAVLGNAHTLSGADWPPMRIETRNSVAYRMALVAAGAFDATVALSTKCDWDIAAADLIAREAGGRVSDHLGAPFAYNLASSRKPSLICAGPALFPLILERVGHIQPHHAA